METDIGGDMDGNGTKNYRTDSPAPLAPPYHPMEIDEDKEISSFPPEGDEGPNDTYRMQFCYGINPRSLTRAHMPPPVPRFEDTMETSQGQRYGRHEDLFGERALDTLQNAFDGPPDFSAPDHEERETELMRDSTRARPGK